VASETAMLSQPLVNILFFMKKRLSICQKRLHIYLP